MLMRLGAHRWRNVVSSSASLERLRHYQIGVVLDKVCNNKISLTLKTLQLRLIFYHK